MMSVVPMPKAGDIDVTMFFCVAVVIGEMSVLESGFQFSGLVPYPIRLRAELWRT